MDVHQQYAQPVQQGSGFNQPLFSPSQIAMDSSSPSHQLDGSAQARMAGAAALTGLRDRWWLLLFGVHLVMLFIVEGMFGSKMTSHWGSGSSSLSKSGQTVVGKRKQHNTTEHNMLYRRAYSLLAAAHECVRCV